MSKEKHIPRRLVSRQDERHNAGYKPPTHEDNYAWSPMPIAPENDLPVLERQPVLPGHEGIDDTLHYYHGLLPRRDVEEILAEEGDFLLRNSETVRGSGVHSICLSVLWKKCAQHHPITVTEAGEFTLDGTLKFTKILDLINYYFKKKRPFKENAIRLLTPVGRQSWEFLHSQVELKKKIGEGAFGAIYSGYLMPKSSAIPIPVAVKALKCTFQSKEKIEELMSEARMMRHLDHPNIVRMYGVATAVEPLFIVMELLDNGSLDEFLKRSGAHVAMEERLVMIRDVMYAIEFIHSRGIIHCDIAARNCLCGKDEVKLSDFGMAKNTDRHNLTPLDRTPVRWAAPEVFTERVTTKATDIWAMGVLVWEVFNDAKLPYEEMEGQQIRDKLVNSNLRVPKLPDFAPHEMNDLLDKMVLRDPNLRITAVGVFNALEKICTKYAIPHTDPHAKRKPFHTSGTSGKASSGKARDSGKTRKSCSKPPSKMTAGNSNRPPSRNRKTNRRAVTARKKTKQ